MKITILLKILSTSSHPLRLQFSHRPNLNKNHFMDATFSYLNSILFVFLENACNAYILLATKVVQVVNVVVFLNQSLNNSYIFGHFLVHICSNPVSRLKVCITVLTP